MGNIQRVYRDGEKKKKTLKNKRMLERRMSIRRKSFHGSQMKGEINNIKCTDRRVEVTPCQEIQHIHSLDKYMRITYYVSSIDAEETAVNKKSRLLVYSLSPSSLPEKDKR